jgi:lipopolysaccharide transport system permease protein
MVPWVLFSAAIPDMVESLVANMNLVTKIYFPREILVLAVLLARLLDFVIAFSVLILLMVIQGLPVFSLNWLYLPLILAAQLALMLGIGLIGSALNVFYRDIKHIIPLGIQIWFFATPIIYPVTMVPENLRPFYFINPMAGIIEGYRAVLLHSTAPGNYLWLSMLIGVILLLVGYWFFKKVEFRFADII